MPGGVGVELESIRCGDAVRRFRKPGTCRDGVFVGSADVVDVQVEMDLLRLAIGPVGPDVIRISVSRSAVSSGLGPFDVVAVPSLDAPRGGLSVAEAVQPLHALSGAAASGELDEPFLE